MGRRDATRRRSRRTARAATAAALLVAATVRAAEPEVSDCRYGDGVTGDAAQGWQRSLLPGDDVFRPPLADVKEPRFSASYQRVRFRSRGLPGERRGEDVNAGVVGFGANFGLAGLRRNGGCDGAQLGVFGAVLSQFNLDAPSSDLINSDFLVGFPLSLRAGRFSGRARVFHQSSHLGDEFLLNNPEVDRVNLSFEALDALASVEVGWLRAYGGGGWIARSEPELERGMAQAGVELRGMAGPWPLTANVQATPLAGGDFKWLAEQDWDTTTSVAAGLEIANPRSRHRLRILFVYLEGFLPFGQFFNTEKVESVGVAAQFEL